MIVIDFETKSLCNLTEVGAHVYAAHPSTEIVSLHYSITDEVRTWLPGDVNPTRLLDLLAEGRQVAAFNSPFDRQIWEQCTPPDWYRPHPEQWVDIMGIAAYLALPTSLEGCAEALDLAEKKSGLGEALIKTYLVPQKDCTLKEITPDILEQIVAYGEQDVRTAKNILEVLGTLTPGEQKWWLLEQEINDRGITIDLPSVRGLKEMVEAEANLHNEEIKTLTNGIITKPTQAARIVSWVDEREPGLLANCQKGSIGEALEAVQTPEVKRLLEIRRDGSLSSTAKLYAMEAGAGADGRARGLMQYHGAATGREAGRRVQPQNLFRPDEKWVDLGITPPQAIAMGVDVIKALYGSPTLAVASMLRNLLVAAPGKVLMAGDFASIESVVNAALAGEERKLDIFRRINKGLEEDVYCALAPMVYGYPIAKATHKLERQVCKIAELASGFGGSIGAWLRFGADRLGWEDEAILDKVKAWRSSHPNIVASWKGYETAAASAVATPGQVFSYRDVHFKVVGDFLKCRLPSGRCLSYFKPELMTGKFGGLTFSFLGMKQLDNGGRAWQRIGTYGGKLCENITQATARDLMVHSCHVLDEAGYDIVLTVHDEIVLEHDQDEAEEVARLMGIMPDFAKDWPVKAEVWCDTRYRK